MSKKKKKRIFILFLILAKYITLSVSRHFMSLSGLEKKYNTHKCVCEKAINEDEKTFGSFR